MTLPGAKAALLALLALLPGGALAQASQCVLPARLPTTTPVVADGPVRRATIAGYTLAASWSPDYCKMSGDADSMQCSGQNGRFGFVLHGLWPEAAGGPPPQWCGDGAVPPMAMLRRNLCMTPSAPLLVHEWAKHGSCMTRRPDIYYRVSAILWRSIRWPDAVRLSHRPDLTTGDLRSLFVVANPSWRTDAVGLDISRTGWLRAIRLCYDRRFMPRRCPARQFGPGDAAAIRIWRGR